MTDQQAKILSALRQSNTALTQAEVATAADIDAGAALSDLLALGAAGYVQKQGSFFSLVRAGR